MLKEVGCPASAILMLAAVCLEKPAAADGIQPYLQLKLGRALFTDASAETFELETPSGEPITGFALGADINRFLGFEIATRNVETTLLGPGGDKVAEAANWTFLGQARLRHPIFDGRIVPYGLLGAGISWMQINDRDVTSALSDIRGDDVDLVAVVGFGAEYFTADNIALGLEAKRLLGASGEIETDNSTDRLNLDTIDLTGNIRVMLGDLGAPADATRAKTQRGISHEGIRPYLVLRAGSALFTRPHSVDGLTIESPSEFLGSAAVGLNINEHLSFELAGDYTETELSIDEPSGTAEYALWTILAQVRLRASLGDSRFSPYLVGGGGWGFGEINDVRQPANVSGLRGGRDNTAVASIGAGLDYFIADNLALSLEAKHIFGFDPDIEFGGRKVGLEIEPVFLSAGLRILFP